MATKNKNQRVHRGSHSSVAPKNKKKRVKRNVIERRARTKRSKARGTFKDPNHSHPSRSATANEFPRKNLAARTLYELLGGRDGVLDLVCDLPTSQDNSKLNILRDILSSEEMMGKRKDGESKMSFGSMLATSGVSEKEIYQLFLDRKRAETLVTLASAEPHLAAEVVSSASSKYVPCRECGGTKKVYFEMNGEEVVKDCNQCDRRGMEIVEGSFKHQELFFDLTKLKQIPTTQINTNVDNRSVSFQVGQPGTAPTPLSMIKSLDRIRDQGPRPNQQALPAPSTIPDAMLPNELPVKEAELVSK